MMSKELSKFTEPTVILPLLIGIAYFLGWLYTLNYFRRFGIQLESLSLSTTYYLSNAIHIGIHILVLYIIFYWGYKYAPEGSIKQHVYPIHKTIYIIIIIFLLASAISGFIGNAHAKNLIAGDRGDTFFINFSWKDEPTKEIDGKELILIIYNEHKYYVVAKQKPAPNNPEIYIIPDDLIEFASIRKK
ncbi:MAG: hypothetical protein KAH86_08265 [Methanosarcinales archaeon]|nr:hypothetical protein [Methanosarcinales archaeon]